MDSSRNLTPTQVTEVEICRSNLFSVFRMAIKSVIDLYFVNKLTEQSAELHNLLVIFEKLVTFDFKPSPRYPTVWSFIKNCDSVLCKFARHKNASNGSTTKTRSDENCCEIFEQVLSLDAKQTTDQCRVRTWARICLMHKRFSHHFRMFCARSDEVLRCFYGSLSMFYLRDQMAILCDDLMGLNALDFTFQLKDENYLDYLFVIDYSPYLNFSQCPESQQIDDLELSRLRLNGNNRRSSDVRISESIASEDISQPDYEDDSLLDPETFFGPDSGNDGASGGMQNVPLGINLRLHGDQGSPTIANDELHRSKTVRVHSPHPPSNNGSGAISRSVSAISLNSSVFADLVNQKSFLEEMLSQKTNQVEILKAENERLKHVIKMAESSASNERHDYEAIILELQEQISQMHCNNSKAMNQTPPANINSASKNRLSNGAKFDAVVIKENGHSSKQSSSATANQNTSVPSKAKAAHPL